MSKKILTIALLILTLLCPVPPLVAGVYSLITNYPVGNSPASVCLGNLRGKIGGSQLYRDIGVANYGDNTVSVRLCLDDGTFGHEDIYPVGQSPCSIMFGDLNGDGSTDLATANFATNTVSVIYNQGVGANFTAAAHFVVGSSANPGPRAVTFADINGDSRMDIITVNYNENSVSVLTNQGNGTFASPTNYTVDSGPSAIFRADMNGDGRTDVVTANAVGGTISILSGQIGGTLSAASTTVLHAGGDPQPVCVVAHDLNQDSVMDLITADYNSNTVSILIGDASGGFWTVESQDALDAGAHPKSLCVRDFNHDGFPDIAVANEGDNNVQVYFGFGDGTFESQGVFAVGAAPSGLAGSNFNDDQATDLAAANSGDNTVSILLFAGPLAYSFNQNVNEDVPTTVTLRGSLLSGQPLLYEIVVLPTNGVISGSGMNLLYTPNTNYFGLDGFTYQTVDTNASLTSAVATVSINILPVNDRPSFSISSNMVTVLEDAATTNIINFATNLLAGPENETNQNLSFILTTTNVGFFAVKPSINASGKLSFRPARNATGTATVIAYMSDNGGTLRGGTNLTLSQTFTVVVEPHPLKPHKGIFNGLYYGTNGVVAHYNSGFFTFNMAAYGRLSGKIIGDGGKFPFTGQFDLSGHAQVYVARNNTTLVLDLQLDLTNGTDQVVGTATDNQFIYSEMMGDRAVYHAVTNPAPLLGYYTLLIPGNGNPTNAPGGDSYATVSIASNGTIRATGKLSDNTSLSQSVSISKYGYWPFYASFLSGQGSALGWLVFTNLPATSLQGSVSWLRPATSSKYYPHGFTNITTVVGSTFSAPIDGDRVLETTNTLLILNGGNVNGSFTNNATLTVINTVVVNNTTVLGLAYPNYGRMTGTFLHPTINVNRTFNGVVLQQQGVVRGFFLGTNLSGAFRLEPND